MKITIQNQFLKAEINRRGAELVSVEKDGKNFIWEIDENFWDKTSPVLFPVIGGLKGNTYEYQNKKYQLPRHGFARECDFELVSKTEDSAVFTLKYSEETLKVFPFKFTLSVKYYIIQNEIFIKYTVSNTSSERMYYSIGAHPAFAVCGDFQDYALEFDLAENLTSHQLEDHLFSGKTREVDLEGRILPLNYSLFENDAVVLKNSATSSLSLLKNNIPLLKVNFSQFPFLGIWTKKDAPFICIEPWLGIADSHHSTGKIEEKEGIQVLEPYAEQSFEWSVEFF